MLKNKNEVGIPYGSHIEIDIDEDQGALVIMPDGRFYRTSEIQSITIETKNSCYRWVK